MTASDATTRKPYQIVVGFDFSELGERAVEEALAISGHHSPAELHVVTVARRAGTLVRLPRDTEAISEELARDAVRVHVGQVFEEYRASRGPLDLDRIAVYVVPGLPTDDPAKLIVELATEVVADLVVVGTHSRSRLARAVLGSVAQQVVRSAPTSVYVVHPPDFAPWHGVPGGEPSFVPGAGRPKRFEQSRTYLHADRLTDWDRRTVPIS